MNESYMMDGLLYLYGIVARAEAPSGCASLGLEVVHHSNLSAIVEPVPRDDFAPEVLEQRLASVEWVTSLARKHEAVLETIMERGPVIPARLCTMFSQADAVRTVLADNEEKYLDALNRLRGRQEWGLKLFCDEQQLEATAGAVDPELKALDAAVEAAKAGQAYILSKRRNARRAEVAAERIDAAMDELLGALEALPIETRDRPLLRMETTGRREAMVANLAALVGVADLDSFRAAVEEVASRQGPDGFALELSGPWPPYSFCSEDSVESEEGPALSTEGSP